MGCGCGKNRSARNVEARAPRAAMEYRVVHPDGEFSVAEDLKAAQQIAGPDDKIQAVRV